jgi:uncharacterized protein YndB with AHSA1/START domain
MTRPEPQTHELLIERDFPMNPRDLFELWADPDHRIRWWGPKNFTCTEYEADFRAGGAWRATIVSEQWGESGMSGVFREIVPGERLVFTFAWDDGRDQPGLETLVTVTLTASDSGTRQSFHQTPFLTAESRDSHVSGWNECFDREVDYSARSGGQG